MSSTTTNLKLFKYDTTTDAALPFSINTALNNNWDKLDTHVNNKVSKSGDIMTGNLIIQRDSLGYIDIKNSEVDITQTPTENTSIGSYRIKDTNGVIVGQIFATAYANGATQTRIFTRNSKNGSTVDTRIDLGLDKNGNPFTWCPACDSNNSILTTASLTKNQTGYLKLGNGIIIQWGHIISNSTRYETGRTINLSTSFSSANSYELILSQYCPNTGGSMDFNDFSIASKTVSTITLRLENTEYQSGIGYIAIGY